MRDLVFSYIPFFILGSIVGSFLNVCIYRIPLKLSLISPRSHCPYCKKPLPFYENLPLISFVLLKGKCSSCKNPISLRYPFVELLCGFMAVSLKLKFGLGFPMLFYFVFLSTLVVITFIDLKYHIIPDIISLPGAGLGLFISLFVPWINFVDAFLGFLIGGGILFAISQIYYLLTKREGMGFGDVKLLAMIGTFLGWKGAIISLVTAAFLGTFIGLLVMIKEKKDSKYPIPFGPFLSMGAFTFVFFGKEIITCYIYLNS